MESISTCSAGIPGQQNKADVVLQNQRGRAAYLPPQPSPRGRFRKRAAAQVTVASLRRAAATQQAGS
jgi:hypothetical protein